jgi:hypothetical protein
MRWTCLSLVAIRPILADRPECADCGERAVETFARQDDTGNDDALATAQKIDETLGKASDCLHKAIRSTAQDRRPDRKK